MSKSSRIHKRLRNLYSRILHRVQAWHGDGDGKLLAAPSTAEILFESLEPRVMLAADLVVTSVSDTVAFYSTGSLLQAQAHIANIGSFLSNTGSFDLEFWLSKDGVTSKFRFIESGRVLNVLAGVPTSDIINVPGYRIPTDIPQGRYHITVYLDTGNDVAESNESNNVGKSPSFTIGQPDLEVPSVTVTDTNLGYGQFLHAEATIANTGLGSTFQQAALGFDLTYFLGSVDGSNKTQFQLENGKVSFLNGGQSTTDIINPPGFLITPAIAPGDYRVWVRADSGGDVVESDENNNFGSSEIITIGRPDLTVSSVTLNNASGVHASNVYAYNDILNVTTEVTNIGQGSTLLDAPLGFNVTYYLGAVNATTDAQRTQVQLQEAFMAVVGEGQTRSDNLLKLLLPTGFQPGEYRVWVKADSGNDVSEANENNNWRGSEVLTIQGARWEDEDGNLLGDEIPEATPVYLAVYSDQIASVTNIGVDIFEDDVLVNDFLEDLVLEHVDSPGNLKWSKRWIPYRTVDLVGGVSNPEYFFRVKNENVIPTLFDASSNLKVVPNDGEFGVMLVEHTVGTGVPLVLVHGNNSDTTYDLYYWKGFLNWIEDHLADYAEFDVWLWKHDTSLAVGFNGGEGSQADRLAGFIYDELELGKVGTQYEDKKVALVAHSQGGLDSRSFMNTFNTDLGHYQGEDVSTLITLDTPHHGSPFGIQDWVAVLWSQLFGTGAAAAVSFEALRAAALGTDPGDLNLAWTNQDGVIQGAVNSFDNTILPYVLTLRDTNAISGFPDPSVVYGDALKNDFGTLAKLNTSDAFIHKLVTIAAYDTSLADNVSPADFAAQLLLGGVLPVHEQLSAVTNLLALMSGFQLGNFNPSNYIANDGLVPLQSQLLLNLPATGIAFSSIDANLNVTIDEDLIAAHAPQDMLYRIFSSADGIADHADVLETTNPQYWTYITDRIRAVLETTLPIATLVTPAGGSGIPLPLINDRKYIDVNFTDAGGSTLDPTTILDPQAEFTLVGTAATGVEIEGLPVRISDSVFRYSFTGDFSAGSIGIKFLAGSFADDAGNVNAEQVAQFRVTDDSQPGTTEAYGISDSGDHLGTIDVATGEFIPIGQLRSADGQTLFDDLENLAFDPTTGVLYGVNTSTLVSIDPATAIVTIIGDTGLIDVDAVTFNAIGQMFVVDGRPNPGRLFTIDKATGQATLVNDLIMPVPDELVQMGAIDPKLDGVAFDPVSGDLIGAYSSYGSMTYMVRVRMSDGQILNIGASAIDDIEDIAFGPDGVLYGSLGDTGAIHGQSSGSFEGLVRIDLLTGVGTPIGLFGTPLVDGRWDVEGLAIAPQTSGSANPAAALSVTHTTTIAPEDESIGFATATLSETLPATLASPIAIGDGSAKSLMFTDADATTVTIFVKGAQGFVHFTDAVDIFETKNSIIVTGTDIAVAQLHLDDAVNARIRVTTKGGDGRATFGGLSVDGSATYIKMPGVDVEGDILVTGLAKKISLGSVTGSLASQRSISLGGNAKEKPVRLTFSQLTDVNLNSDSPVKLTVLSWTDSDPDTNPDSLTVPYATVINAKGNSRKGIAGQWSADVNLTGEGATKVSLKSFKAHSLSDAVFDIIGAIGTFNVSKGSVDAFTLNAQGDAKSIKLGDVSDTSMTLNDIGTLQAIRWQDGQIMAAAIRKLKITGDRKSSIAGDLNASLIIDGIASSKTVLHSAKIAGLLAGHWQITGSVGSIKTGVADQLAGTVTGTVKSFNSKSAFSGRPAAFSFTKVDIGSHLIDATPIAGGNPAGTDFNSLRTAAT